MAGDMLSRIDGGNVSPRTLHENGITKEDALKMLDFLKHRHNLFNTEAGKIAMELDGADGKYDGKISASVWNKYADAHGGKHIKTSISVHKALDSITTYTVREK